MLTFILITLVCVFGNHKVKDRVIKRKERLQEIQEDLIRLLHKTIDQDIAESEFDLEDSESDSTEESDPDFTANGESDPDFTMADRPHIFFFLADDYGWANIGYHSPDNPEVSTPNLNKLMAEGVELDRFYTFNQCGPSRSALLSGRDAQHVNYKNNGAMAWNATNKVSGYGGVPPNMTLMGTKMKEAGYKTAYTGKWDVGFASVGQMPYNNGFDTFLGYLQHANSYCSTKTPFQALGSVDVCQSRFFDFWEMDKDGHRPSPLAGTAYEEEFFLEKSLEVINNHNPEDPLFLFHSSHLLHTPLQVPKKWLENFDFMPQNGKSDFLRRQYAAMTQYMDNQVGLLTDALKKKGMWDNTLFVFQSDNGGPVYTPAGANNYPLRGGKATDLEGGIRVNAFVSGGYIPKANRGSKVEELGYISDWYTTFCKLAGVDEFDQLGHDYGLPPVDGIDLWPMITKKGNGRHELFVSTKSVIMGKYKLMTGQHGFDIRTGPNYPNNICTKTAHGKEECPDVDQPGPNSGYWLPCVADDDDPEVCTKSARGEESFARFYSYPKSLEHLGHWVLDCNEHEYGCLFNIWDDPEEYNDLGSDPLYRDTAAKLYARLEEMRLTTFDPPRGAENFLACVAGFYYNGYIGPFLDEHGEPLWDLNSETQPAPSCDACEYKEVVIDGQEEFCVHYPDPDRGFACTPYIDGKCTVPVTPPAALGINVPVESRFLCGTSFSQGYIQEMEDEFYYAETAEESLLKMETWEGEKTSMSVPFTDMCPHLDVRQARPPVHVRRN